MNRRKKVLVTGATSGVGYETVMRFYRIPTDSLFMQQEGHKTNFGSFKTKGQLRFLQILLIKTEMESLLEQTGPLDIIIFSAGVGHFEAAHLMPDEAIQSMMDTNIIAPIELTKSVLPSMMEQREGHLIYIGSQAGKVATPKASVYAATKHALIGYTNALRMEVASVWHSCFRHPSWSDRYPIHRHSRQNGKLSFISR